MSTRRLVPQDPYTPNGGVNKDANSITIAQNQCNGIKNLRVMPYEVRTRDGSKKVAGNTPGGDPILHFHTYKRPNFEEDVFAFTKQAIFQLNQGTGYWELAHNKYQDIFDGTLGSSLPANTHWNDFFVNPESGPHPGIYAQCDASNTRTTFFNLGDTYVIYKFATTQDFSAYTKMLLRYNHFVECYAGTLTTTGSWTLKFCTDLAGTVVAGTATISLTRRGISEIGDPYFTIFDLPTPASLTAIKSIVFCTPKWESDVSSGWYADLQILSSSGIGLVVFNGLGLDDITFWSTAPFVDTTEGATIIAAASVPPAPTDAESDGGARTLLYYDPTAGYFKSYTPRADTPSGDITTAHDGGGTGKGPFSGTLAHTPIIPFTVYFFSGGYKLTDDGNGNLRGDGSGTINYTTGAYTLQFSNGVGLVTANYYYYTTYSRMPRFVTNYNNRIMYSNVYEDSLYYPWRVRWSDVGDFKTIRAASYRDLLDDDISPIAAVAYSGEYLVFYRHDSVVKMRVVGGDYLFGFHTVWQYGIFAGRSVLEWNNYNFVLGKDDVYKFDGNQFVSIATQRVRNDIFSCINKGQILNCFASYDDQYKEYWLWIVTDGNTYPTKVYVYSLQYDTWSIFEFEPTSAVGKYYVLAAPTIDQLTGTIDQQGWRFNEGVLDGTIRVPLLAKYGGGVYVIDYRTGEDYVEDVTGTPIAWYMITKDFVGKDLPRKDRLQRMHFEATGALVEVGVTGKYTQDPAEFDSLVQYNLSGPYNEYQYWPDKVHEHTRLLFQGSGAFSLRWLQAFSIVEEKD